MELTAKYAEYAEEEAGAEPTGSHNTFPFLSGYRTQNRLARLLEQ